MLKEALEESLKLENGLAIVLFAFTILSIAEAGIGIYGFSVTMALSRTKEVVIRRIHDASNKEIFIRLSKYAISPVWIASIIAIPIAFVFVFRWLEQFPIRIGFPELTGLTLIALIFILAISTMIVSMNTRGILATSSATFLREE